jgi:nitrite reductase/ring-hydroxylating ferredoxin subunit/uncharacterized membrane protein
MEIYTAVRRLGKAEALDRAARPLAQAVARRVRPGALKDALTGKWLGHPLHPLLTDIPIGSLTSATLLDLVGGARSSSAADTLVAVGLAAAVPTALAGATDWSDTYGEDQRIGVVHALANTVGLGCYALSLVARHRGARGAGTALGLAGLGSMTVGGYLGGHLGYSRGVGVNHTFLDEHPTDWTPVLAEADLAEGKPTRVTAVQAPVLLYRSNGTIYAIGARCSHAGGPLEEGVVDVSACTVECPWHHSVFRLGDGGVVHGPASMPQPAYDVRVDGGRVEVRER